MHTVNFMCNMTIDRLIDLSIIHIVDFCFSFTYFWSLDLSMVLVLYVHICTTSVAETFNLVPSDTHNWMSISCGYGFCGPFECLKFLCWQIDAIAFWSNVYIPLIKEFSYSDTWGISLFLSFFRKKICVKCSRDLGSHKNHFESTKYHVVSSKALFTFKPAFAQDHLNAFCDQIGLGAGASTLHG